jgi:hypothetical protein
LNPRQLKDDVNRDYMLLLLNQNSSGLVTSLGQFRDWFSDLKRKIATKRAEEVASLQSAR